MKVPTISSVLGHQRRARVSCDGTRTAVNHTTLHHSYTTIHPCVGYESRPYPIIRQYAVIAVGISSKLLSMNDIHKRIQQSLIAFNKINKRHRNNLYNNTSRQVMRLAAMCVSTNTNYYCFAFEIRRCVSARMRASEARASYFRASTS